MRAPSPSTQLLLRHGAVAWPLVRTGFALALLMSLNPPFPVGGALSLGVITLTAVVALLAMRRRREHILMANLAIGVPLQATLVAVPAAILEVALAMVLP